MTRKKPGQKSAKRHSSAISKKEAQVKKLVQWIGEKPVVAAIDIRALPDRLLQAARKKLRGKADIIVAKNSVIKKALESSKKASILSSEIKSPTALVLSDMTPYALFTFFKTNKSSVAAKPGQLAPFDIVVHEGETDLPPGPALSELKGAGINAQIKGGKIIVAKDSIVAKSGAKISDAVCKALSKLNIFPFEARLNMVAAVEEGKVYGASVLDIDQAQLFADLQNCLAQSFNVSYNCSYPTSQNIDALLKDAYSQGNNLAINGGVYSDASSELLLTQAVLLGETLSSKVGNLENKTQA
ncbi:50S ribosomal protein L10 [Candidatus Micrarchaeota archaeon]|nr:50S ribosomal protein L10 [Candidatus Micrarchaeota archaeon]